MKILLTQCGNETNSFAIGKTTFAGQFGDGRLCKNS